MFRGSRLLHAGVHWRHFHHRPLHARSGADRGVDGGGGRKGECNAAEGVLDKGVVTVSPPNNKQPTLTLICLFYPSPLLLSRRGALPRAFHLSSSSSSSSSRSVKRVKIYQNAREIVLTRRNCSCCRGEVVIGCNWNVWMRRVNEGKGSIWILRIGGLEYFIFIGILISISRWIKRSFLSCTKNEWKVSFKHIFLLFRFIHFEYLFIYLQRKVVKKNYQSSVIRLRFLFLSFGYVSNSKKLG